MNAGQGVRALDRLQESGIQIERRMMQRRPLNSEAVATTVTFELGGAEWAALPSLGVPAILARIDTGARTSALHADQIEIYQTPEGPRVRFVVHPVTGRRDITRKCDAPLIARRWIASSNGARELRCVVSTLVEIGERRWLAEMTLTNRGRMRYRMLLGRRAILDDMVVVPRRGNRQRTIGYGIYDEAVSLHPSRQIASMAIETPKQLRIGLIGEGPIGKVWQMLVDTALARGHVVERIDVRSCRLLHNDGHPRIECSGRIVAHLDAAIALGTPNAGAFFLGVLRHAQLAGAVPLNDAEALAAVFDPSRMLQMLWAAQIPTLVDALPASASRPEASSRGARHHKRLSGFVVDGEIVACAWLKTADLTADDTSPPFVNATAKVPERRLMLRAARTLGLGAGRIDVLRLKNREPVVAGADASASLLGFAKTAKFDPALVLITALEKRAGETALATRAVHADR